MMEKMQVQKKVSHLNLNIIICPRQRRAVSKLTLPQALPPGLISVYKSHKSKEVHDSTSKEFKEHNFIRYA